MSRLDGPLTSLDVDGFALLRAAISESILRTLDERISDVLAAPRSSRGADARVIGSRHLIDDAPELCRRALACIETLVQREVGGSLGLVRALFFDKPIGATWALPWHQDRVIAVRASGASRPGGVPLIDAGDALLRRMLAVRIHLDDADEDNGALRVRPRSHTSVDALEELTVCARRGDVLLMRPLLFHASSRSRSERSRRVLHLELAPTDALPDAAAWHSFWPLRHADDA